MALRLVGLTLKSATPKVPQLGSVAFVHTLDKIGNREIVGYGWNGTACYADRVDYPMPAIRFRETTPEIAKLREKEKGDWKKLSIHEKKALYRASFCQTFAEIKAPSSDWKRHVGFALMAVTGAIWVCVLLNLFVYDELPETFSEERQKAQLKRIIDGQFNPVLGLTSEWDYNNKQWKK